MKLEDCIDDPKFRQAFVEHEISALQRVIQGNDNMVYHNDGKISILNQIKEDLELTDKETDVINEHLTALHSVNGDLKKQSTRLQTMIDIYEKFRDKFSNNSKSNLKLA